MENLRTVETTGNTKNPQEETDSTRLKLLKCLWPATELGGGLAKAFFTTYANFLYTNVYMMGAFFSGIMAVVQNIIRWLGVPVVGTLMDRITFKKAKYYPWILIGTIVSYASWILIFALPALGISGASLRPVAMVLVMTNAVFGVCSAAAIPAVFPRLTQDTKERQVIAMFQKICRDGSKTVFGYLCPAILMFFTLRMDESKAYAVTGLIVGIITMAFYIALALGLRGSSVEYNAAEDARTAGSSKKRLSLAKTFGALVANKALLSMYFFVSLQKIYYFIFLTCATYLFKYVFQDFSKMGTFMVVFNFSAIIGAICGPFGRKIFKDTKRCLVICMGVVLGLLLVMAMFLNQFSAISYICIFAVASFFMGLMESFNMPMFAIAADYGAWKSGNRMDGLTMSIHTLAINTGLLLASVIHTSVLTWIDLDAVVAGAAVSAKFMGGLTVLFGWIPFILGCIALLAILCFPLNDARINQIHADLADRKTSSAS